MKKNDYKFSISLSHIAELASLGILQSPLGLIEILPTFGPSGKQERPCELALEGSRWYDLVRWGIVEETLKAHNKPFVENYVDTKHQLFPIPHSEFLLNPDWEQNPNYSK